MRDEFNLADIKAHCEETTEQVTAAGVKMEKDSLSEKQKDVICEKYHK